MNMGNSARKNFNRLGVQSRQKDGADAPSKMTEKQKRLRRRKRKKR
ncbi:MAG TPA: hypothetical protein VGE34_00385 [Candidatus Saccharimonadales bacterium]